MMTKNLIVFKALSPCNFVIAEAKKTLRVFCGIYQGKFGIGLLEHGQALVFWNTPAPYDLLTCWQTMRSLEDHYYIEEETIAKCYRALKRRQDDGEKLNNEAWQIIGQNDLSVLLTLCQQYEFELNLDSLRESMSVKQIEKTPILREMLIDYDKQKKESDEFFGLMQGGVKPEESFELFCRDFGIGHLCAPPADACLPCWGIYGKGDQDREIILLSLWGGKTGVAIYCCENGVGRRNMGYCGQPVIRLNGRHFAIVRARYSTEDGMKIELCDCSDGRCSAEYSLRYLRKQDIEMVGYAAHGYDNDEESQRRGFVKAKPKNAKNEPKRKAKSARKTLRFWSSIKSMLWR